MSIKKLALGLFAALGIMGATACSNVEYGNVGILVEKYGNAKGVQLDVIQPSTFMVNPLTQELYTFPTTTETTEFCSEDSLTLQTGGGGSVAVCMAVNYSIDEVKVPIFFEKFKSRAAGDKSPSDTVARTYFKQRLKDEMNRAAKPYTPFELLLNQDKVRADALAVLVPEFEAFGFRIESVSYTSALVFPAAVQERINETLESTQAAEKAKQDLLTAEAKNKVDILNNERDNTILVNNANAQAEAMRIRGEAIRTNPQVLQQEAIQRWNGAMPTYIAGGNGPIPFLSILPTK